MARTHRSWILFTAALVVCWGAWGALSSKPTDDYGFPQEMTYVIWSLVMFLPAAFALRGATFDRRGVAARYGLVVGLTGAAGQLVLFEALTLGPAYLIFPIVSASPAITVLLAMAVYRERVRRLGAIGVGCALVAIILLSITSDGGGTGSTLEWLPLAAGICVAWGVQAFFMRGAANRGINEATTFTWMAISGLLLVPLAFAFSDGGPFGYPWQATAWAAGTQLLNAIGALCLVMALARGKAVVVAPSANALAPVVTVIVSLALYATLPSAFGAIGIVLALVGAALIVISDEQEADPEDVTPAVAPERAREPAIAAAAGRERERPRETTRV